MKSTITYTAEVTAIVDATGKVFKPHQIASAIKQILEADDVHIKNLKVFEGTEGGHE